MFIRVTLFTQIHIAGEKVWQNRHLGIIIDLLTHKRLNERENKSEQEEKITDTTGSGGIMKTVLILLCS